MNELTKTKISELNFIPVKPKDGLIGFVSFVWNRQFYFSNISVFTHIKQNGKPTYRLSYPEDQIRKKDLFHPINRKTQEELERSVSSHIDGLMARMGGDHG